MRIDRAAGLMASAVAALVIACVPPVLGPPPQAPCVTTLTPCPTPTPGPTPTPTPAPTPTPTPTAFPPPTMPARCVKLPPVYTCPEGATSTYYYAVRDTVAEILHVQPNDETRYSAAQQKSATMAAMGTLNGRGYCTSYDLQAGNQGMASEMGVRQGEAFAEWYQIFASEGYVRWSGMYRSTCTPAGDEEQLPQVWRCWVQGDPEACQ